MSVEQIFTLGDDQMANQFVLSIPGGIPGGGDEDAICLRMEEAFPMPEESVGEYEIRYQGMLILKTNMTDAMDKHFIINVRVDQQWKVYDDLKAWMQDVYNHIDGTGQSEMATRTTVAVQALDRNKDVVKTFTFRRAKIQKIKVSDFSHTEDTPTKLELTFIFGYMES